MKPALVARLATWSATALVMILRPRFIFGAAPTKTIELPAGGSCEPITGARAAQYTLTQPDLRDYLTVNVEVTNSAGSRNWWSTMSKQVQARPIATTLPAMIRPPLN